MQVASWWITPRDTRVALGLVRPPPPAPSRKGKGESKRSPCGRGWGRVIFSRARKPFVGHPTAGPSRKEQPRDLRTAA